MEIEGEPAHELERLLRGDTSQAHQGKALQSSPFRSTPPPPHPTPQVAPVLGGFNKDDYVSERLWARSSDGTMVPISLVYRKDMYKRDGNANLLLYG